MRTSSSAPTDKILEYTLEAARALQDVAEIPFVVRVCALCFEIIPMVQTTKFQKERCLRIVDDLHRLLYALLALLSESEETDIQSPVMLEQISKCTVTLQKIDSCLRAQQELGKLKRLFKQSEITTQMQNCERELKDALSNFTMSYDVGNISALVAFNIDAEKRHQELLELIVSQSSSSDDWTQFLEYELWLILVTPRLSKNIPWA
ncbi:hypothetical protein K438DRAFT_1985898 [Mycena galopus ATCC 62051]|nr:hypothetical protein K438DRAFT_1985898 [Mycena galopus ATCC 62051]